MLTPLLLLSTLTLGAAPGLSGGDGEPVGASSRRLSLTLGFAHWFGRTFDAPPGIGTPAVGIGIRPGVSFLEVRARYLFTLAPLTRLSGERSRYGQASLALVLCRELSSAGHSLNAFAGPLGVLTHGGAPGVAGGYGAVVGVEYLIASGLSGANRFGIFTQSQALSYSLPGDSPGMRSDVQVDLGFVATLF
ncbi:MAG: hypothetical protein ACYC8T_31915 [Myxococcaceae bacterium]